jgi:hypothetical protein
MSSAAVAASGTSPSASHAGRRCSGAVQRQNQGPRGGKGRSAPVDDLSPYPKLSGRNLPQRAGRAGRPFYACRLIVDSKWQQAALVLKCRKGAHLQSGSAGLDAIERQPAVRSAARRVILARLLAHQNVHERGPKACGHRRARILCWDVAKFYK